MKSQAFLKALSLFLLGAIVVGVILSWPRQIVVSGLLTVQEELTYVNPAPVISPEVYAIIKCESQWKEDAVGDGGRAYGLAQFHRPTWDWLVKLSGKKGLDYYEPSHQIELLTWALENGRGYLWTCARILGYAD